MDHDLAGGELIENSLVVDRLDAGFRECVVGDQPDLPAGEADHLVALRMDGHGHQRDRHLFSGGEKLIHLALGRIVADFFGKFDQLVGGVTHCTDDDDDLVSLFLGRDRALRGRMNVFRVGNRCSAKFLYDQTHESQGIIGRFARCSTPRRGSGIIGRQTRKEKPPMTQEELVQNALLNARDTKQLMIGRGILTRCVELFCSQFHHSPVVIVADERTFRAAGQLVVDAFEHVAHPTMRPIVFSDPNFYAQHKYVEELHARLAPHDGIPIAVGSGSINDITKLAAHRAGRQYMCVPTAASMDGYTAFGASITHEGSKQTFDCPAPRAVLVDSDVIAAAPREMNAWGCADLLAKMTAGADWIVADELGVEPIDADAWQMVQTPLREWTADADGIRRGDRGAIGKLVSGLIVSGFAMQATRSSRPASGAEHQFSHLWDMQHATDASHGAKVGVATVAVARLYEAILRQPLDRIDVDRIVSNWPDITTGERQIDELFHRDTGLRPSVRCGARARGPCHEGCTCRKGQAGNPRQASGSSAVGRATATPARSLADIEGAITRTFASSK